MLTLLTLAKPAAIQHQPFLTSALVASNRILTRPLTQVLNIRPTLVNITARPIIGTAQLVASLAAASIGAPSIVAEMIAELRMLDTFVNVATLPAT